jgi:hypothetical protein
MFTHKEWADHLGKARKEKSLYIDMFYDLSFVYMDRAKHNISAPEEMILMYIEKTKEEPIYRIVIHEDGMVETGCYEMLDAFDPELNNSYKSVDELPNWVQDKLAVLMLLDHKKVNEEVKGVGRRINERTYWVFKGELGGNDPRR